MLMKSVGLKSLAFMFTTATLISQVAMAQQDGPAPSPAAMVQQVVGVEPITIKYSSPGVKGRTIWGDLVPHTDVWRAGANAKTTIEFGADVTVGGTALKAGTYGIHVKPEADSWTFYICNDPTGSPMPNSFAEDHVVASVTVTPEAAPFRERLAYTFDNMTDDSATCSLHWAKLKGSFDIKLGSGGPSVSAEAQPVLDVVNAVMAKLASQDVDGTMTHYADDFTSDQGGKAEYQEFLVGAKEQGFLEDMEVLMDDLAIEVDGDSASVEGIEVEGAFGVLTIEFEMKKRGASWIITSMTQY